MKNKWILYAASIFLVLLQHSCKERFVIDSIDFESHLVVDGRITNEPGPYFVNLSKSSQVDEPVQYPWTDCKVTIMDNTGEQELLTELEPGKYSTAEDGIQGIPGRSYKLVIETPEGTIYESDFEQMPETVGIDSIYSEIDYKPVEDEFYDELPGYQFYMNTEVANKDSTYFMWEAEETYEYTAQYFIDAVIHHWAIWEFDDERKYYRCWATEKINTMYLGTTAGLSKPQLKNRPLFFVGTETRKLSVRYSLLLKQLVLNKEAYQFWSDVNSIISESGFFVDKQPYQIGGNIRNSENPDELVLGYFTVAGITRKRAYFKKPDLKFYYETCITNPDLSALLASPRSAWPIYLTENENGELVGAGKKCFDCRLSGGKIQKPAFWDDGF